MLSYKTNEKFLDWPIKELPYKSMNKCIVTSTSTDQNCLVVQVQISLCLGDFNERILLIQRAEHASPTTQSLMYRTLHLDKIMELIPFSYTAQLF